MASPAQVKANQSNAQHSTGPTSIEGKAQGRINPLRHGLTSKHLIIPGENPADFEDLLIQLTVQYDPATPTEQSLVAEVAEHTWRLIRARRVETSSLGLYMGKMQEDANNDPDTALALAHHTFGRELDRIRRYETSIVRSHARAVTELKKHIHTRISEAAIVQPATQPAQIGSASQKLSSPHLPLAPIDGSAAVSYHSECPTIMVGDR